MPAIIDESSLTTTTETTKAVRVHPAVKVERESRQMFAKVWTCMHLEWSYTEHGRIGD